MLTSMYYSMPVSSIFTVPEVAAARQQAALAGLGVTMDDYGNVIPDVPDSGGYGYDAAGNTIVNPGVTMPPIVSPSGAQANTQGLNLNALISQGFSLTKQIIQTQPGVYTQSGPNGTLTYRQPLANTSNLPFVGGGTLPTSVAGSLTGTLNPSTLGVVALAGVALLVVMSMGRR